MAVLAGDWGRPVNTSAHEKGGIHDDETAQDLGFSGGTVAGSLHMEQFPPLLLEHFGADWWRRGNLSLYFRQATMDRDPVRCFLEPGDADRARVWMENEAGDVIMSGSAALGEDLESELRQRVAQVRPATDLRMLADIRVGEVCEPLTARAGDDQIDARLKVITEPLPLYEHNAQENARWGGRVLPAAACIHTFRGVETPLAPVRGPFVGLFGAIEIQYLAGPVVSERDYELTGQVLAVSESPKTEVIWFEATLADPTNGTPVARMIKMDRLMKGASPLWQAEASGSEA
ncbi:MAG: hypothetical protein AAF515_01100 [Pseudomonadota bacterium]